VLPAEATRAAAIENVIARELNEGISGLLDYFHKTARVVVFMNAAVRGLNRFRLLMARKSPRNFRRRGLSVR
jgi:hypothetical protein